MIVDFFFQVSRQSRSLCGSRRAAGHKQGQDHERGEIKTKMKIVLI